jgi:alkylation response protein AidB-like acyl-CoA dehydrogenase
MSTEGRQAGSTEGRQAGDLWTTLESHAAEADAVSAWPATSWEALRRADVLGWCLPPEYGGQGLDGLDLLGGYERLAGACLTTCFILSQRDAACRRLRDSDREDLRQELLPPLARGETFATVGLSQLTTSRQHGAPALRASSVEGGFRLEGTIPWVTGAERADFFVIGATLDDGRQILSVLPRRLEGVSVGPPLDLMALQGSLTAEVRCNHVTLPPRWLLAGPAERVMAGGRGGTGGLETSCLALGLAGAALAYLGREAEGRRDLLPPALKLQEGRDGLRSELRHFAAAGCTPEQAAALRARANALVLQTTQTALAASKGSGFLRQHPAQRWARQALFFLVWSCPRPAVEATLAYLTSPPAM